MAKNPKDPSRFVAQNRKARHNYFIDDTIEAGIILTGTEVKSLRAGKASIGEAYAGDKDGHLYLFNANITEYEGGNRHNHLPTRPRKLLLHKREVERLLGAVNRKGMTIVPLDIHFNDRGYAKVTLGIARGKQMHDKRTTAKTRDWQRDKARLMREKG